MTIMTDFDTHMLGVLARYKNGDLTQRRALAEIKKGINRQGPWFPLKDAVARWGGHKVDTLRKKAKDPLNLKYFRKVGGQVQIHEDWFTTKL